MIQVNFISFAFGFYNSFTSFFYNIRTLANYYTYKLIKLVTTNISASKIFSENVTVISIKSKFRLK